MPRPAPSYRLHKPTGQAVVTLNGRDVYLGVHGTPRSMAEYDRTIALWLANGRRLPAAGEGPTDLVVNEVILRYWRFAEAHYSRDGVQSKELANIRDALRPLKALFGNTPAAEFGPKSLKAVRQAMVDAKLARTTINSRVGKIKRVFRWAVGEELVPASLYHGLQAVEGLRLGRGGIREAPPVRPVADEHVAAVLPHVSPQIRAMIQIQDLTGMRPGEVLSMRTCDVDRTGPVWVYRPARHKTELKGRSRAIAIGPRGQAVLTPWLRDDPQEFLFQPHEARRAQDAERRRNRKSPMTPSQRARRPKANPKRPPRGRYSRWSYNTAIARACDVAGVPQWFPNQLRHSAATRVRRMFNLEAAQVVLGHAKADVTQIYAERDLDQARAIMGQVG